LGGFGTTPVNKGCLFRGPQDSRCLLQNQKNKGQNIKGCLIPDAGYLMLDAGAFCHHSLSEIRLMFKIQCLTLLYLSPIIYHLSSSPEKQTPQLPAPAACNQVQEPQGL